jgi:protein-S-isoprenylcysteine O-methyltransferase Ste14
MLLIRSIFFTFLFPGSVTVLIPYFILLGKAPDLELGPIHFAGVLLIAIGAFGLLWCIWQFFAEGRGTLAPVDSPKELVVHGLYRVVRNPMYVSVALVLLGESIFFASFGILIEAAVFFCVTHLFIVFYEEPYLKKQFGTSYEAYQRTTRRWIPFPR